MDHTIIKLQENGVSTLATELYRHLKGGKHIKNLDEVDRRIRSSSQCSSAHARTDLDEFMGLAYKKNYENQRNYNSFNREGIEL